MTTPAKWPLREITIHVNTKHKTSTTSIKSNQRQKKQAKEEASLAVFCPKCRDKHPLREWPLNKVPICTLCEKDHETQQCPSLPGIKAALQSTEEEAEAIYLLTQRRQWQPRGQGMNSNMPFTSSNRWNNYPSFNQANYPPFNEMQYPPFNQMNYPPVSSYCSRYSFFMIGISQAKYVELCSLQCSIFAQTVSKWRRLLQDSFNCLQIL